MRKILPLFLGLILLVGTGLPGWAAPSAGRSAIGTVTDLNGRPIQGAEVEAYRLGEGLMAILTTDETGSFRLPADSPGGALWLLRVWAKGYRLLETGWVDLATHPYQSLRLEPLLGHCQITLRDQEGRPIAGSVTVAAADGRIVAEGEATGGRYRAEGLMPGQYRVSATALGYLTDATTLTVVPGETAATVIALTPATLTVAGLVADATTQQPVSGATVLLVNDARVQVVAGNTDPEGRFRLVAAGAAPGQYRVRVAAAGYRASESAAVRLVPGDERDFTGGDAIQVQPNSTALSGVVLNTSGAKVPNATVVLELKGYGEWRTTRADKDGEYRFDGVPWQTDAPVRLSAGEPNYRFQTDWFPLKSAGWNQMVLQEQVEVTHSFGAGDVAGVVLTPAGAPVGGATVELLRGGAETRKAMTGPDGAFLLKDVPGTVQASWHTAPYMVRISKSGYSTTREFTVDGREGTGLDVLPRSRTMLKAVLHRATVTVSGRVTDTEGRAVAGVSVRLQADGDDQGQASATDAFGWYSLNEVPIRPDTAYWLQVEANGYLTPVPLDVTAAVTAGTALPSVRLTKAQSLMTGLVLGPDGTPVAQATVAFIGPMGERFAEARSDEAGYYQVQIALPSAGPLRMSVTREGYTRLLVEADLPAAGQRVTRNVTLLPATAALSGRVLDGAMQVVPGALVELLEEGRGVVATVRTAADGRFRFDPVALGGPGWFWLRVSPTRGRFAGALTDGANLVPLQRLLPGQERVLDLQVR